MPPRKNITSPNNKEPVTSSEPTTPTSKPPAPSITPNSNKGILSPRNMVFYIPASIVALFAFVYLRPQAVSAWGAQDVPQFAQVVNPKSFAVLDYVPPPAISNGSTYFVPPGSTSQSLKAKPFHIYSDEFYNVIGTNPTLTLLSETSGDPLFHEAVVWYPPTDEVFFVQNAGAKAAGTGLQKSAIIQKIALSQAAAAVGKSNSTIPITTVNAQPTVVNPNGATNYMGKIVFMGEGQGDNITSSLYLMDPTPPYNTTVILNNYFGRQFSSLNDGAVNPRNKELYFTDVTYGYLQDFRPAPGLPNQVYRFNYNTGVVRAVQDGFDKPNGITFSPDGSVAYVADTGAANGFRGNNFTEPTTIYSFTVNQDGTWSNRKTFAYVDSGFPDGVHCDTQGYVYAGCGDGVHVFNPSGLLIGKIYLGTVTANFQFAGQGRMVICAETQLYYATLAATGASITDYNYSDVY